MYSKELKLLFITLKGVPVNCNIIRIYHTASRKAALKSENLLMADFQLENMESPVDYWRILYHINLIITLVFITESL